MAITQLSSVSWDQAAYNRLAYFSLRPQLYFDQFPDVKPSAQAMPGTSVVFDITADIAAATSALTETSDVTPATMSDSQVTLTLAEYGNAVQTTAKLRATSFLPVNVNAAEVIGYNAGLSIDTLCRDAFSAGTNVFYGGTATSRTTVGTAENVTAAKVRYARAKLIGGNSMPFPGGYIAVIHPDCEYDLRSETGSGSWRAPREYVDPSDIYNGEIGLFEGFRFIISPQANLRANASNDAGSTGNIDVYDTVFFGRQAVAKAYAMQDGYGENPVMVISPVTDSLRRFVAFGWKHLVAYGEFRAASLWRLEAASTIGTNS